MDSHSLSLYIKARDQRTNAVVTDLSLSFPCRGKVFSHILLECVQSLLQMTQRPQQSWFTAGRSTIDAILALQLLSELHRQFNRPLYVAFVDIKSAFDSVDRNALWKTLRARGIPDILLNLTFTLILVPQ